MDIQQSSQIEANKSKILGAAYAGKGEIVTLDYEDDFGISRKEPVGQVRIALAELIKNGLVVEKGAPDDGINVLITALGISAYEKELFDNLPPDHPSRGKFA
ncbi:hypothetical protein ACOIDZ_29960 [Klebsiella pneumoniae]|uniref:hypothetical protein n=4 Tax=Klebsiella pneumoniae TaxID=573 RepID=UPI001090B482|nr:hypothetical protein [Klebsiella pneumoniae]HAF2404777.1 hypothetical protein [Salmonella enterica]HAZ4831521.1 hypothetical protein [Citrobacter freundii]HCI7307469.1 hypothetical protein [Klebsiella pneumoniae subsp. pneumoniae Kp001]MBQ5031749.1 hypothetical protein [Klebsiella pneumoniae]MDM9073708.1 hypothetical protein [Klebsiella pneumoniae]